MAAVTLEQAAADDSVRLVMIAYDRSEHAHEALVYYARNMYREASDRVVVVCVGRHESDRAAAETAVEQGVRTLGEAGVSESTVLEPVVRVGVSVKEGIVELGETHAVDLLVLGSRGRGRVARLFLGSISTYAAHHSSRPLLIVKAGVVAGERSSETQFGAKDSDASILVCLDGSRAAEAAFRAGLVAAHGRELILFTVVEPVREFPGLGGEDLDTMDASIQDALLKLHQRKLDAAEAMLADFEDRARDITDNIKAYVAVGDARDMISRTVETASTDIICIGTSGKTAETVEMTVGSVASHVLHSVAVQAVLIHPALTTPA